MRKLSAVILLYLAVFGLHAASMDTGAKSALTLRANALLKDDVQQSLSYLTSHIVLASSEKERRSILYYTGTLQEQLGYYADAAVSYADAAAIDEEDAKGMPKATNEQLYLYAARASLGAGDFVSADKYLDALPVIYSKDSTIIAQKRLYSAWSSLCKAEDFHEAKGVIANLNSFSEDSSMRCVRPTVLFTLWYLTEENTYADILRKDYPSSPEVAIIDGKNQIMTIPFWYFVPRASAIEEDSSAESFAWKDPAVEASQQLASESVSTGSTVTSVALDTESQIPLWTLVNKAGFTSKNGFLAHGENEGDGVFCWVHTRKKSDGKLKVSTQSLIDNNSMLANYTSEHAYYDSVNTYGGERNVALDPSSSINTVRPSSSDNGGTSGGNGGSTPAPNPSSGDDNTGGGF